MKNFLDYASKKYYDGEPIISDAEFDALAEEHKYEKVGADTQSGVAHMFPMYSLNKCYPDDKPIDLGGETVETPKFDGAAVSLLYVGGVFMRGLTRGDGKRGEDITDKLRFLVPEKLNYYEVYPHIWQITGEVCAKKDIPNARNYAAGALNLKDLEEFKTRKLVFIAYGCQPSIERLYTSDMDHLHGMGFYEVYGTGNYLAANYPTDGTVVRLNDNEAFHVAGYTSKHPRGAYAKKVRQEGVVTRLNAVEWQVGRSGVVAPVAILEPVMVGEAKVSRATLHNMNYIENLGLEIGCDVEIIRSGEIIPRVVRRV